MLKNLLYIFLLCITWQHGLADQSKESPIVLIAILARNKAHVLPTYLECIENLEYDKKSLIIYVNTNNNLDNTCEILRKWLKKHKHNYRHTIFDNWNYTVKTKDDHIPHSWNDGNKLKILGGIRNKSLKKAQEYHCDYYFVVDCDNFIVPSTLKDLISKQKPIIAPMLVPFQKSSLLSNFFCTLEDKGNPIYSDEYWKIFKKIKVGTFRVPIVHCTYLIDCTYINKLSYIDNSSNLEFLIFSESARKNGIGQYICNEKHYGTILHFAELNQMLSLKEESKLVSSMTLSPYLENNRKKP